MVDCCPQKALLLALGPWPNHKCVQPEVSVFRRSYMLLCVGKVLCVLQCFIWCLTSCVLLPWVDEVQCKMWAQVAFSPMLLQVGKLLSLC